MRRCFVPAREDETMPRPRVRPYAERRGDVSSSSGRIRRCFVPTLEDEAAPRPRTERRGGTLSLSCKARLPRLPAGERGDVSSPSRKRRRCLVFQQANEVLPHPRTGR
ncbi:hypothetical protein GW17_00023355 [Ensete ventricosum]|nr:hypothetical protein GW17_00023355 [Ensete ventricosum]